MTAQPPVQHHCNVRTTRPQRGECGVSTRQRVQQATGALCKRLGEGGYARSGGINVVRRGKLRMAVVACGIADATLAAVSSHARGQGRIGKD
jgi:hypothetical protein